MKTLTMTAAFVLGLTAQAIAGSATEATAKSNPGVTPKLAQNHVPKYDIVTAKVAQGVKYQNPAMTVGLNPQPEPPSNALLPSR
jgi:hypothetical protein